LRFGGEGGIDGGLASTAASSDASIFVMRSTSTGSAPSLRLISAISSAWVALNASKASPCWAIRVDSSVMESTFRSGLRYCGAGSAAMSAFVLIPRVRCLEAARRDRLGGGVREAAHIPQEVLEISDGLDVGSV
jgi:hypothetical protein